MRSERVPFGVEDARDRKLGGLIGERCTKDVETDLSAHRIFSADFAQLRSLRIASDG